MKFKAPAVYIHQLKGWPTFTWDADALSAPLSQVRFNQGKLLGKMENLGFHLQEQATLQTVIAEVVKSSEIEGEVLSQAQVRSSVARRLGIHIAGILPADRHVDGVVEMMLDATQNFNNMLTKARLVGWQAALFPTGHSAMYKIKTGGWRTNTKADPMQVVSGGMGKEKVHFEAPQGDVLPKEMTAFITWMNNEKKLEPILKAAIAHLWFVTIHPFDDGNGRIARAITDMLLARADNTAKRFYSMSAQIRKERKGYYNILEQTQKGSLDITAWLQWFLNCLNKSITASDAALKGITAKSKFWERNVKTVLNTRQTFIIYKLLDGFDGKLNTGKWAKLAKCSNDTALRDVQDLVTKKVLIKEEGGGRSTSYALSL